MPEDAGKKRYIKDFLQQVKTGAGFIDDIRIERVVRPPGADGEGSTARSLSGRTISNITQLLEDDLSHTFDDGYFTFRFVAALVGSGKTSLLSYLDELTKTKPTYQQHCVVVQFQLSDLPMGSGSHSFSKKLYCHILADTFWQLLHNQNLFISVRNVAEKILSEFLESSLVSQLKTATSCLPFRNKFKHYIADNVDSFEEFFFYVVNEISAVDPRFTCVYLIDELDALENFSAELQETRLVFKELIRRAFQKYKAKSRLLMYLVGTSNNVGSFINGDSVIESLVGGLVINLNKGYNNEFEMIRAKIDARIKGAYRGYQNFSQAWQEIQHIPLNPTSTLRYFCQDYASAVLEIHEKYFKEASEQVFEGDARQLVEAQCKQQWATYLSKVGYNISAVSTTTVVRDHAFDCYVELHHNGNCVARAFGEAKNYELLSSHFETFKQWLSDVEFKPSTSDGHPPDLAFMIAPSCPPLLQRKLNLKKIQFFLSDKVTKTTVEVSQTDVAINSSGASTQNSEEICPSFFDFFEDDTTSININTASKPELIKAFKGTGIRKTTIDKLIRNRHDKSYKSLDEMESNGLISTQAVKNSLQKKLNKGEICF